MSKENHPAFDVMANSIGQSAIEALNIVFEQRVAVAVVVVHLDSGQSALMSDIADRDALATLLKGALGAAEGARPVRVEIDGELIEPAKTH